MRTGEIRCAGEIACGGEIPLRGVRDGFHFTVRRSRTISPEGKARGFHCGASRDFIVVLFCSICYIIEGVYWCSLEWGQPYPNGESPERFFNRIKNAWQSLKQEEKERQGNTLRVTHGGVIDVILCLENGKPYTNRQVTYRIAHAEIVRAV